MKRLHEPPRGLVIANLDGVEHFFDEFRPQPILIVDRCLSLGLGAAVAMFSLSLMPWTPSSTRARRPIAAPALAQPAWAA
ncbi:hypothetical protein H9L15_06550 [Sphingomonas daechungensis]|uniref:Uncharacterized protein n=1 Tax=Sphingomonas daechungensis TaxID=1176646 RepID=A0ABX6T2R7_9SPHN|nr:hypothetical protein [Sphingomonas daechungensis]QNP44166.1 hypothetical protein H9L15_06550 [Sphingomonas daechungensis]